MTLNPVKIALCFHGIHGGEKNTGKNYSVTNFNTGINNSSVNVLKSVIKHLNKNILPYNDIDIFLHSWDTSLEKEITELYKPKKFIIEKQKTFNIPKYVGTQPMGGGYDKQRGQAHYSRWYSFKKSNELKQQFEIENNFKYDLVIHSRFDLCWLEKIIFSDYFDPKYFYTSTPIHHGREYPDRWFISSSDKLDKIASIYDNLNEFCNPNSKKYIPQYSGISSHFILYSYLNDYLGYPVKHLWKYPEKHKMYRDL